MRTHVGGQLKSLKFSFIHRSQLPSEQGVRVLEGYLSLPALQPLPCLSRSCVAERGMGTWYISIPRLKSIELFGARHLSQVLLPISGF